MTPPRTPAKAPAKRAPARKASTPAPTPEPILEVELIHARWRRQPWRFRVRSIGNHATIVWSESYANRDDRDDAVELLRAGMATARTVAREERPA